jgi:hypothetical protein
MPVLCVPPLEARPWPTLGPVLAHFLEARAIYGPGDLRGEPYVVDDETRALLFRSYELYPRAHKLAGRRRFKRVGWSLRKGLAKTEKAALIAYAELHPEAPVRFAGWAKGGEESSTGYVYRRGEPMGRPVSDPYIPLVAYTEEQTEELAYGALYVIVTEGPDADLFDAGLDRIVRYAGDGKATALAAAPDSRDGARTTFQHFDETHRLTSPRLLEAHGTMLGNIPKRPLADPWTLETTTAFAPGEGSIAEKTHEYATAVADGRIKDSRLFYFHREASDSHDLATEAGVRAAVLEASGPYDELTDVESILDVWRDPNTDRSYFERVWTNRPRRAADQAFDAERWKTLRVKRKADRRPPAHGTLIVVGFDGARFHDSTALVGTDVATGVQWPIRVWEQPLGPAGEGWGVPTDEVDEAVDSTFELYNVWRMYADPPYWESFVSEWQGRHGDKRVVEWWTNRLRPMSYAVRAYRHAMTGGEVTHLGDWEDTGDDVLSRHIGNARRKLLNYRDDEGNPLFVIRKERHDSPLKIDAASAGVLSWEARRDAIAAGALEQAEEPEYAELYYGGARRPRR